MNILDKALEPVQKFFVENGPGVQGINGPIDGTSMLRLDWELAYDGTQEGLDEILSNSEKTVSTMIDFMKLDLEDLIVNGDYHSNDALLTALDGEKKTGKKAKEILIPNFSFYREVRPKKNSVEFTVFLRFGIKY